MKQANNDALSEAIQACRKGFYTVGLFSFCINLLMLTAPLYMLQIFDRVLSSRSGETLMVLTLVAGLALLVLALLDSLRGIVLLRVGNWIDRQVSMEVLKASILAALRAPEGGSVQGLRDVATIRGFIAGPSVFPIMDAPWTPIFLIVTFVLHPILGFIALAGAILLFGLALINELTTRGPLKLSASAQIAALREAEAAIRNADAIEAMGMMPNLVQRWGRHNVLTLILQGEAGSRGSAVTAASKFLRLVLQIGIFASGAWLVIGGELTPGAMIAGAILMSRALAPVEQAIGSWRALIAAQSARARVEQFLADNPRRDASMALPRPAGRVVVDNVSYIHPGAPDPAVRAVRFQLEPGEGLGVIGPTAAGKTTLSRLMIGNLQPKIGHVRLDGMDVAQWSSEDMGRYVGYLPQDVELFNGTVRENIARMTKGDPAMIIDAAKMAGVHEMILHLPKGYDTEIGDAGTALSGGQRQRIALARALYGFPSLLVLDEPSANLDSDGETALLTAVDAMKARGATIVVIAHRPNVLRHVDKILVMRNGRMQMFGPREEVLARVTGPQRGGAAPMVVAAEGGQGAD